jgi:K+ transporter
MSVFQAVMLVLVLVIFSLMMVVCAKLKMILILRALYKGGGGVVNEALNHGKRGGLGRGV